MPDGKSIVVADGNGRIDLWTAGKTFERAKQRPVNRPAYRPSFVLGSTFDISEDGATLAIGEKTALRLMELPGGKTRSIDLKRDAADGKGERKGDPAEAGIVHIQLSPDADLALVGIMGSGTWHALMIDTKTMATLWKDESGDWGSFTAKGRSLAVPLNAYHAKLLDSRTGKLQSEIKFSDKQPRKTEPNVRYPAEELRATFAPDGRHVAVMLGDQQSFLFKAGLTRIAELETGKAYPLFAFSSDGALLAGAVENRILIWRTDTGERMKTLRGHTGVIQSLSFDRDGSRLVSCGNDCQVLVWSVR